MATPYNTILLTSEKEENPKPFRSYINPSNENSTGVASLKYKNQLFSAAIHRAAIVSSVFNKDAHPKTKNILPKWTKLPRDAPFKVAERGVLKLLNNISPSKAGGPDRLPARVIKELATGIAPVLTTILCQALNTGEVPTE